MVQEMVQQLETPATDEIIYPESDGQPMADSTKQFRCIVTVKENLELLFAAAADVFVAGGEHPIFGIPLTPNPSPTRGEGRILDFSPLSLHGRGGLGG